MVAARVVLVSTGGVAGWRELVQDWARVVGLVLIELRFVAVDQDEKQQFAGRFEETLAEWWGCQQSEYWCSYLEFVPPFLSLFVST